MNLAMSIRVAAVLAAWLLAAAPAHAIYKCGKVYQDKPCPDGPQVVMNPSMPATPASPTGATPGHAASPGPANAPAGDQFTSQCAPAGEAAQKVAWKREGGASRDQQMAEGAAPSAVVDSVYRKRGSAPEIRAAVVAECVAAKQQAAEATAAVRALQAQQAAASQYNTPAAPAAADPSPVAQKVTTATPSVNSACPAYRAQLDAVHADMRTGGSAAAMERHQNRRRDIEKQMREAKC